MDGGVGGHDSYDESNGEHRHFNQESLGYVAALSAQALKFHHSNCIHKRGKSEERYYSSVLLKQVWSLTQFFAVDILQSRIGVKSTFSTNAQSRFASVVLYGVQGPPRLSGHT